MCVRVEVCVCVHVCVGRHLPGVGAGTRAREVHICVCKRFRNVSCQIRSRIPHTNTLFPHVRRLCRDMNFFCIRSDRAKYRNQIRSHTQVDAQLLSDMCFQMTMALPCGCVCSCACACVCVWEASKRHRSYIRHTRTHTLPLPISLFGGVD